MFEPRANHPFLEVIFERDCQDIFLQIGFRELFCSGVAFSKMAQGNHVCLGMIPDPSSFDVKLSALTDAQYVEHLAGSTMNQFIKRVLCRQHMGAFDALQMFKGKQSPQLNPQALEVFMQMVLSGFPMLSGKIKTDDEQVQVMFCSRGDWQTKSGYKLPPLAPRVLDFKFATMQNEFELMRFQAKNSHDLAGHAMKAKMLSAVSSLIYGMHYSELVPDAELTDPNRIFVSDKKVVQSNNLEYMLEKVRRNA